MGIKISMIKILNLLISRSSSSIIAKKNFVMCSTNLEFQRQRAKDLTRYFRKLKRDKKIQDDKILGWTLKNEITNGRWVMTGLAIGLLTEFSTGVNFIEQIKLTISYMGIADMADYL